MAYVATATHGDGVLKKIKFRSRFQQHWEIPSEASSSDKLRLAHVVTFRNETYMKAFMRNYAAVNVVLALMHDEPVKKEEDRDTSFEKFEEIRARGRNPLVRSLGPVGEYDFIFGLWEMHMETMGLSYIPNPGQTVLKSKMHPRAAGHRLYKVGFKTMIFRYEVDDDFDTKAIEQDQAFREAKADRKARVEARGSQFARAYDSRRYERDGPPRRVVRSRMRAADRQVDGGAFDDLFEDSADDGADSEDEEEHARKMTRKKHNTNQKRKR